MWKVVSQISALSGESSASIAKSLDSSAIFHVSPSDYLSDARVDEMIKEVDSVNAGSIRLVERPLYEIPLMVTQFKNNNYVEQQPETVNADTKCIKDLIWYNTVFEFQEQLDIHNSLRDYRLSKEPEKNDTSIRKSAEKISEPLSEQFPRSSGLETDADDQTDECRYLDPRASILPWEEEKRMATGTKWDEASTIRQNDPLGKFTAYLQMPTSGAKSEEKVKKGSNLKKMKEAQSKFEKVFPLATPKGKEFDKCEVCNTRAHYVCKACRVTFYCSLQHGELDSEHHEVCVLLKFIRSGQPKNYTRFERWRYEKHLWRAKGDLVDRLMWQGIKSLAVGKYVQANASLNQSMHYTKSLVGNKSVEMLRLCLLKSQGSLHLDNVEAAENELRVAEEVMSHLPDVHDDHMITSEIARVTALLEMTRSSWDEGLFWFSEALLQLAYMNAHDSIYSARIYFDMAVIFFYKGQKSVAESLFIHSLENYTTWLVQIYTAQVINRDKKDGIFSSLISKPTDTFILNEVNLPLNLESDSLVHLKKLHLVFRLHKDRNYAKVLMSFALLSFFKVLPKESMKFIDGARPYFSKQSDPILHHTAIDAYRRTRRYVAVMEKSAAKTLTKWKGGGGGKTPAPAPQIKKKKENKKKKSALAGLLEK